MRKTLPSQPNLALVVSFPLVGGGTSKASLKDPASEAPENLPELKQARIRKARRWTLSRLLRRPPTS